LESSDFLFKSKTAGLATVLAGVKLGLVFLL
jgi:hypothetical protein